MPKTGRLTVNDDLPPPAIHGAMRFPFNNGPAIAVKSKPGLGSDTAGLPKFTEA
jgi:hypothetical protein